MNLNWESELERLRADQKELRLRLEELDIRITRLSRQRPEESASVSPPEVPARLEKSPPLAPPPLPAIRPLPTPAPDRVAEVPSRPERVASPVSVPPPLPAEASLELKVGQYWLVRVGILVLLTGLVLLGNLAYHTFVVKLGAPGKLALLYLAGVLVGSLGWWLEQRAETTRAYGRVLLAGGVATVYYASYAAHFVEPLRVITSPWLGGVLLLGLAGGLTWLAERRRSQGVAFVAVLLSYYTAAINPAANFTLFSNLVLTGVAVFLLVRHRWLNISWLSLAGAYGGFAYWGARAGGGWPLVSGEPFWPAQGFLVAYWVVFALAVFLQKSETFSAGQRMVFLTANNVLFYGLSAPGFAAWHRGEFWIFSLVFGGVLLGLSMLARRKTGRDSGFDGSWMGQGLVAVAIGLVARFSGYQLALLLVVFSAALVFASGYRQRILLEVAAGLAGTGAFFLALRALDGPTDHGWITGLAVAVFLLGTARLLKHARSTAGTPRWEWAVAGFSLMALLLGGAVLENRFQEASLSWAFAVGAVVLTPSRRVLLLPEVVPLAQGFLAAAGLVVVGAVWGGGLVWSEAMPVMGAALFMMFWWRRQKTFPGPMAKGWEAADAFVFCAVLLMALSCHDPKPSGMVVMAGTGLGVLVYGLVTRAWFLTGFGQVFTVLGALGFVRVLLEGESDWRLTLVTLALIGGQAALLVRISSTGRESLRPIVVLYMAVLSGLGALWVLNTLPSAWQFLVLVLVAGGIFLFAARGRNPEGLLHVLGFAGLGFVVFGVRSLTGAPVSGSDAIALLGLLGLQQAARVMLAGTGWFPPVEQALVAVAALAGLWVQATRWTWQSESGLAVTVVWAALAFGILAAGFLRRERTWRLMGLFILGVAVGHVFLVDVWKMGQFAGILGILALAVVLLVLGFVYNRFADTIKKWL